jgi:hypothetical protein
MEHILRLFSEEMAADRLPNLTTYLIVGFFGGLVRELSMRRNIVILPKRWENGNKSGWDVGIVGSIITSMFVAVVIDSSVTASAMAAVGAPHLIELWAKRVDNGNKKSPPP